MKKTLLLVTAGLLSTNVLASNFDDNQEAIEYRKDVFGLIAYNFSDMKAMLKGEKDFNQQLFEIRANNVKALSSTGNVYLCGGGVRNQYLFDLLRKELPCFSLSSIETLNINSDALEAMAFAWLAYAYKNNLMSNMPSVTGASESTTLGVLFTP